MKVQNIKIKIGQKKEGIHQPDEELTLSNVEAEVQKNQNKTGQKEVGGVDTRRWRYRKTQNRTEGSGWGGYAEVEVQKTPK